MGDPLRRAKTAIATDALAKWEHRIGQDARTGRDDWSTLWPLVAGDIVQAIEDAQPALDAAYQAGVSTTTREDA